MSLLEVRDLAVTFVADGEEVRVLDGVSFQVGRGEVLGLVGESGCGKSVTALSILRLVPDPPGRIVGGEVLFEGRDLLVLDEDEMRRVRGARIGMVFQEPMTALNPVFTVGDQVAEVLEVHAGLARSEARGRVVDLFRRVGLPEAERAFDRYPHELSGGMRQRVLIAMAVACSPSLLLADEPTTALDVTIQAQILRLFDGLRRESGMSVLFVTHDLGVVAEVADRVAVMYAGRIVETGPVEDVFRAPAHPYTAGLLQSLPERSPPGEPLPTIPGQVPAPGELPSGCRFRTRCPIATGVCEREDPALLPLDGRGRAAACHHSDEVVLP